MNALIRWLRRLLALMLGRPMTLSHPHPTQNRPMPMSAIQPPSADSPITPVETASPPPADTEPESPAEILDETPHLLPDEATLQDATDPEIGDPEIETELDEDEGEDETMETPDADPVDVSALSSELSGLLEALLFVSESPASPAQLAQALQRPEIDVRAGLADLQTLYKETGRGLRLQERNDRFSLVTAPQAAAAIENFLNLDLSSRLSAPALETLAIVAYRQPVTKSQIEAVRGVDCGGVLRTLLQRELIEETGRLDTVGRPILYGVTDTFMQHFGLENMQELPPLQMPDADALWATTELAEE